MRPDGSGVFNSGQDRLGLGAGLSSNPNDPFEAFRLNRAHKYRDRIEERILLGPEATAQKCYACNGTGHFARECPSLSKK